MLLYDDAVLECMKSANLTLTELTLMLGGTSRNDHKTFHKTVTATAGPVRLLVTREAESLYHPISFIWQYVRLVCKVSEKCVAMVTMSALQGHLKIVR